MKTKIIFNYCIIILLIGIISATSITLEIKPSFGVGEEVSFDYTILSSVNEEIQYGISVLCPNAPLPLIQIKNATLIANSPLTEKYIYLSKVGNKLTSQDCIALVEIISPNKITTTKPFSITTNPSFDFRIQLCKDLSCTKESNIFVKGEEIYLTYNSNLEGLSIEANLIYPNEETKKLDLPILIPADQIGTYALSIIVSKEGYKEIEQKIQFAVIEEEANIGYGRISLENTSYEKMIPYFILIIGLIFIVIILLIVFLSKRKKKK